MGERVVVEKRGHVWAFGLNRPAKRNAFDLQMLRELAEAYTAFEADEEARCGVLYAEGDHFTAGLDLAEVGPAVEEGAALFPTDGVDPLGLYGLNGTVRTKPVVSAVQGWCLTIGIELLLATDIRVAAEGTRFGQIEVGRGIFPFGGATVRLPLEVGWGNAMRWLLTGEVFPVDEAQRIGFIQEVVPHGEQKARALAIAERIATQAPLGVAATLRSAAITRQQGPTVAAEALLAEARRLMATADAAEGLQSFLERRDAVFKGR